MFKISLLLDILADAGSKVFPLNIELDLLSPPRYAEGVR